MVTYQIKSSKKLADELSESDGKILGASTSGNGKLVEYSNGCEAKQKLFVEAFTHETLFRTQKNPNQFESIHKKLSSEKPIDESLKDLLNEKINNKTLKQLSKEYKIQFSSRSKSGFRLLINKILNIDRKKHPKKLMNLGFRLKQFLLTQNTTHGNQCPFQKFHWLIYLMKNGNFQMMMIVKNLNQLSKTK